MRERVVALSPTGGENHRDAARSDNQEKTEAIGFAGFRRVKMFVFGRGEPG